MANKKDKSGTVKLKMTYNELLADFWPAIQYMGALTIKNLDTLTNITKAKKAAKKHFLEFSELKKTIVEQECKKDAEGNPEIETLESGEQIYNYPTEELKIETQNRIRELTEKKISFEVTPINIKRLRNVDSLNANMVDSLGDFIEIE